MFEWIRKLFRLEEAGGCLQDSKHSAPIVEIGKSYYFMLDHDTLTATVLDVQGDWVKYECQRVSGNPFAPRRPIYRSSTHKEDFLRTYSTPVKESKHD